MSKKATGPRATSPRTSKGTVPAPRHVKRSATKPPAVELSQGGAIVRMYCTGLGDCFLIGLPKDHGEVGYVMIDCGVWKGTPGSSEWMRMIMEDIRQTVGSEGIEILVATHPHWDHLSGFGQAKEIFDEIPVKEVWLPWTEDEGDPQARRLAMQRQLAIRAALAASVKLRSVAALARAANIDAEADRTLAAARDIDELLKFVGRTPPDDDAALDEDAALVAAGLRAAAPGFGSGPGLSELAAAPGTDDLLGYVKARASRPRYLRPSTKPVPSPAFPGVKIFALGPPTDPKLLGRDDPSKGPGKSEVFATLALAALSAGPASEQAALLAGAVEPDAVDYEEQRQRRELAFPFDSRYRIPAEQAYKDPGHGEFFRAMYGTGATDPGTGATDPGTGATDPGTAWRRIDTDWLEAVGGLALDLDDHINNTSLVLAFELGQGDEAPVLLFPGDAQVGNWLSWHTLDSDGRFAEDLLRRTVLYKVGHHASHNATLKAKGLSRMARTDRLVAMIPIDAAEAHKPKGSNSQGWDMPYGKLLDELLSRTEGRVMRADTGVALLDGSKPEGWNNAKWEQFQRDTHIERRSIVIKGVELSRPFYIQYTIRLAATE
jgi:Metallo-beta-lactamase superfamily